MQFWLNRTLQVFSGMVLDIISGENIKFTVLNFGDSLYLFQFLLCI